MKNNKKKLIISLCIIIVVILIALFSRGNTDQKVTEVKIGAAFALSGDAAEWGEMSLKGAQLAVDELNQKGGINNTSVRLVVEDTGSNAKRSMSAVSKLANVDKVEGIVGPSWLDIYHGPASIAESSDIVMITPDSGTEAMNDSQKLPNVYSTWYRIEPKVRLLAKEIAKKHDTLFIITPNDSFYIHFGGMLKKFAEEEGITVVGHEKFNDDSDVRAELLNVRKSKAGSIFFTSYSEKHFGEYARSIKEISSDIALYGDEFTKEYIDKDKFINELEGVVYFHAVKPQSSFVESFEQKYDVSPAFGASTSYDAVYMFAQTFENKKSGQSDAEYIDTNIFDAVSYGKIGFDDIGGVTTENQQYDLFQLVDGQPVLFD